MTKHDLFHKLTKPKLTDRILLLTHTDLDGAGPSILMQAIFDNVTVQHCTNSTMSYDIKNAIMNDELNAQYDFIIACDISCNEHDAEVINNSSRCDKLVVLDHHLTATALNDYKWACVTSTIPEDSYRMDYISDACSHSGTSLMYDYLDYCNLIDRINNLDICMDLVNQIALYDTWDWVNIYGKTNLNPYKLNTLFYIYGTEMFECNMINLISNFSQDSLFNDTDNLLLKLEAQKISNHLSKVEKGFNTGNILMNNKYYSIVFCNDTEYMSDTFDHMKNIYPDYDLYIINYGTGISMRATKPEINIGLISKQFGGGGHAGAGGFKIPFETQVAYIAQAFNATIYVDEKE